MIGWLIETGIAVTVLMLLVLALRRPVAHFFGAGWAYALWLLPALRIVLPPLHMFGDALPSMWRTASEAPAVASSGAVIAATPGFDWQPIILTVWVGGAALIMAWQIWSYLCFARRLGIGSQVQASLAQEIGIIESPEVDGPLAIGLLDRWIVVPTDFTTRYTPQEQRLALEHERTHHRREDILCNMVALGVLALNWFNPIAYIAFRAFRADQELSCDAVVAARASAVERHDYARALVKSASRPGLIAACPLNEAGQLKRRLRMMKAHRCGRLRAAAGSGAVAAILLTGISVTESASIAAAQPASVVRTASSPLPPEAGPSVETGVKLAVKAPEPLKRRNAVSRPRPTQKKDAVEAHASATPSDVAAPEVAGTPRRIAFTPVLESPSEDDQGRVPVRVSEIREFRIIRTGRLNAVSAPEVARELEVVRLQIEQNERLGAETKARLQHALQQAMERARS